MKDLPAWLVSVRDRIGTVPDPAIAIETGMSSQVTSYWRRRLDLPVYQGPRTSPPKNLARYTTRVTLVCQNPACGIDFLTVPSAYNRAMREGLEIKFCSRACFRAAHPRRDDTRSDQDHRAAKSEYDKRLRAERGEEIRKKKREAYYRDHAENLAKAAEKRKTPEFKAQMRAYQKQHSARPEWKEHKRKYDRAFRTERLYGPEWGPVAVALYDLTDTIKERATKRVHRGQGSVQPVTRKETKWLVES